MNHSRQIVKTFNIIVLSLSFLGVLSGCGHSYAELPKRDRNALVDDYSAALSGCNVSAFEGLISEDHMGFAVRGSLGSGMDAQALNMQCDSGIKMSLQPANINWMTESEDYLQVVGFDLVGTLFHPERGTSENNLRVTLVAYSNGDEPMKITHSHISPLR